VYGAVNQFVEYLRKLINAMKKNYPKEKSLT